MRGYFGVGVEGISKAMNVGAVMRTAHAFGAAFMFTVEGVYDRGEVAKSDTSGAWAHLPLYEFADLAAMVLPKDCQLVGVELTDDAVDLPRFHHPARAAYVLGPERGNLSPALTGVCDHVVKIPTRFCVNVGIAAAIVMYDRAQALGRFGPRPAHGGGPVDRLPDHAFGDPVLGRKKRKPR